MTDRSWDPIDDLFGDSSEVASNSFTGNTDSDNLFNEDELDQNELLGIEEGQQNTDYDDFGLDTIVSDETRPPASAVSPVSVKAEQADETQKKKRDKSAESTGKNSTEAFFEEELKNLEPADANCSYNYEEPDYDNLLDYDEEDDLEIDAKQKLPVEVGHGQKSPEAVVSEKPVESQQEPVKAKESEVKESECKSEASVKESVAVEKQVKRGDIDEEDLEDEDEDEEGSKKRRGRSNYWSERAESKSPSNEAETGTVTGNQNFKNYGNSQRPNGRVGYQNGQNGNRLNHSGNGRNNYQPNNFNNIPHNSFNNNINNSNNMIGKFQLAHQNNNALLPLPNLSSFNPAQSQLFNQTNACQIQSPFPTMKHLNNPQFPTSTLMNSPMSLNANSQFRAMGSIQNFNPHLPQMQAQSRPGMPLMNNQLQQQAFNPSFNPVNIRQQQQQHIRPGFNQQQQQQPQMPIQNTSNYINPRTDLTIPPHRISPVMNKCFNPQTNNAPNQFQNFNNGPMSGSSNVNRLPSVAPNFNQPGLLPTPLAQPPQFHQNHMFPQQAPMACFNNPGPSPQFKANQVQPPNQFIHQANMMPPFPQAGQPLPQQQQQQQQIKPSTVYINPTFIAKQKKLGEEQGRQEVLKEMSFQNKGLDKSNQKPQRSRKELDSLLEERLANAMNTSNEKLAKSKSNSNISTASSSATKRKSYENSNERKSNLISSNRIDPSDKLASQNSSPPAKKLMSKVVPQQKPPAVESSIAIVDDPDYAKKIEEQKRKREEILRMKEEKRSQRAKEALTTSKKLEAQPRQHANNSPPIRDIRSVVVSTKSTSMSKRVAGAKPVVIS